MNKTATCITLIQILSTRDDYISTNELAEILEINPRNIKEYIKELVIAGYTIDSRKGFYGGYKLNKGSILPSLKLTLTDKERIQNGVDFLSKSKDFLNFDEYLLSIGKVMSSVERKEDITPLTMIDRFPLKMDRAQLQLRYQELADAIESQLKCEISYTSTSNVTKTYIIHPYKLYVYNGSWFLLAFNERINDFGYYKLNRIEKIYKTRNRFSIMRGYEEKDFLDSFGMKKNGEYYKIELQLTNLNVAMSERIYGRNQQITQIDDKTISFTCEMQNKDMIKSFVMSFGANCKVIAPDWLRDEIKAELWKCLDFYEE